MIIVFSVIIVGSHSIKATIAKFEIENDSESLIVTSEDGSQKFRIEDYLRFIPTGESWEIGDIVKIRYSGKILETDPATFKNIRTVKWYASGSNHEPEEGTSNFPEISLEEPSEEPVKEEPIILPEHWFKFSPTPEDIITFRFVDFKDDPVSGLYIDLYPRVIVEPGEKRVQTGPAPVLTGQTDQNGEIIWRDYFPCREGEEYVLQVTSAAIGERNYTNTTSYVLSDLKGLDGGYIAKYLWEEGHSKGD